MNKLSSFGFYGYFTDKFKLDPARLVIFTRPTKHELDNGLEFFCYTSVTTSIRDISIDLAFAKRSAFRHLWITKNSFI